MHLLIPVSLGLAFVALQAAQTPPPDSAPVPEVTSPPPAETVVPPPAVETPVPDVDAELVTARCTTCHAASRFESKHLTQDQWQGVVTRMISFGARVTPDEEPTIVAWLASHYGPEEAPAAPAQEAPANSVEAQ